MDRYEAMMAACNRLGPKWAAAWLSEKMGKAHAAMVSYLCEGGEDRREAMVEALSGAQLGLDNLFWSMGSEAMQERNRMEQRHVNELYTAAISTEGKRVAK